MPNRWQIKIPRAIERRASLIKYGILAGAIVYFLVDARSADLSVHRAVLDVRAARQDAGALDRRSALLLVASLFVRNAYCRFLCPLGAALGVLSKLTVFRIKRWSECQHCRICEKACEWGAIRGPQIVLTECVRCDDCERLYEDTKKCPHHLIIIRKADIMARRSVARSRSSRPVSPLDTSTSFPSRHDHAFDVGQLLDQRHPGLRSEHEHAGGQRVGQDRAAWPRSSRFGSRAPARPSSGSRMW